MERFNKKIQNEIKFFIQQWNNQKMNNKEIERYFDNCCSVYNGYHDLKMYIEEDGEKISIQGLKECNWCKKLSNNMVIMFG